MTTLTKPITRFVTLDKPFDIAGVFAHKKKKPSRVMVMLMPEYEEDTDPDRIEVTPKNKKAYKQAMIDYEKGETYDTDDLRSMFQKRGIIL